MANLKISELTTAGALTGAELVELVQGGLNKKSTTQDIADLGGGGAVDSVNGATGVVVLDAGDIAFTPTGTIAATDVQAAIAEVASEAGAGVSDGDKGDVVVSSSGTVWTVEAGTESAAGKLELATAAETLTGTDNTRATHPAGVLATYPRGLAMVAATGAVVSFAIPQYYGSAAAITGNVTFSTTGAVLGMEQVMRHNSATEPTFPSEFKIMQGSRTYVTSVDNFIYMKYLSATKIQFTINQEQ